MGRPVSPARLRAKLSSERFYKGQPCKNGHIGWRYVSTNACRQCVAAQVRLRQKAGGRSPSQKNIRDPAFATRLKKACEGHEHCPALHQGRLRWMQARLAEKGIKVEIESIRKWLAGEARPRQNKCEVLAQILNVDPIHLYMGSNGVIDPGQRSRPLETDMPAVPIAIRPGVIIEVRGLPIDLSRAEANKVASIVLAHASSD